MRHDGEDQTIVGVVGQSLESDAFNLGTRTENGLAPARVSFNTELCLLAQVVTSIQPWNFHYILHITRVQCYFNVLLQ